LGLDGHAKATIPPSFVGSLLAKFRWNRTKRLSEKTVGTTKAIPEIILIGPFGEAIAIGDPVYGDPHKEYGLLSHVYPKDVPEMSEP
jgi:hypothetical protein